MKYIDTYDDFVNENFLKKIYQNFFDKDKTKYFGKLGAGILPIAKDTKRILINKRLIFKHLNNEKTN